MYQLKITRPGSLLPVILEREIDDRMVSVIKLVIESDISYGEALAIFGPDEDHRAPARAWFDAPIGAGDDVEAYRG